MKPEIVKPGEGQESVWDYPEPPRWEDTFRHLQVIFNEVVIADTRQGVRVLRRGYPPVYFFPPVDVLKECLEPLSETHPDASLGEAKLYTVKVGQKTAEKAAWRYSRPKHPYDRIKNYIAFFPELMDACTVDGEIATPQPGGYRGGWITQDIVGPYFGEPGSEEW